MTLDPSMTSAADIDFNNIVVDTSFLEHPDSA